MIVKLVGTLDLPSVRLLPWQDFLFPYQLFKQHESQLFCILSFSFNKSLDYLFFPLIFIGRLQVRTQKHCLQ